MSFSISSDKQAWEAWQSAHEGEFLQSWEWGEFQRGVGQEPVRLELSDRAKMQGFIHRLPLGVKYLYVPKCRIKNSEFRIFFEFLQSLEYVFVRLEPVIPIDSSFYILHSALTKNRQPQHTLILNLTKSPEQILADMHPKTRYNIHLAERKGVAIRREKNIGIFWQLNQETTKRDEFRSHGRAYYEKMLALPMVEQLTAYVGESPIAANLVIVYGKRATYLHGASATNARELMSPYLLQWSGMKLAKERGCTEYDLWGVAPPSRKPARQSPDGSRRLAGGPEAGSRKLVETCFHDYCWEAAHPWTGVTRFKAGFGGMPKSYPSAMDVVFKPRIYFLYQWARRVAGLL